MEVLIRMLVAVFMVIVGLASQPSATPPPPDDSATSRIFTTIESVTANVLSTTPAQIELAVSGYQPDGCDFPVIVDQSQTGSTITVSIYREMPADMMCPAVLRDYAETIHLDGTFAPGTYTVNVNDLQIEVTVPNS